MRIKLDISDEKYQIVKSELEQLGIEIDDTANFVLLEKNLFVDHLNVSSQDNDEIIRLATKDIIFIESFGHNVEVTTAIATYKTKERLYYLNSVLNPEEFIRISNSVIVAKNSIKKIKATFSCKYMLTLTNGKEVDVTRTYYYMFKNLMNI